MKSSCQSGSLRGRGELYATGLHELVHWNGAASRLNREKGNKFGSEAYAFEETDRRAGSAFLMAGELRERGSMKAISRPG